MPTPGLIVVFLDQASNTFKVCSEQTLQLKKSGDGVTSLGFVEQRQKYVPGGADPVVVAIGPDGKPEMETVFVPLLNFPVDIVAPKDQPKIELATEADVKKVAKRKKVTLQ